MALERGADLAEINAERASWLVQLGMLAEAGRAYERSLAANAEATRRNVSIANAGAVAAIAGGGAAGLRKFVEANGLAESDDPLIMLELANAELLCGDIRRSRSYADRALASTTLLPEDLLSPYAARVGFSYLPMLAAVLRGTGDEAGAKKYQDELGRVLDDLSASGVQTYGLFALKAQLAAMRGLPDEAMKELERAAALGWSDAWLAERQPCFESLRERRDFRELLATVRARNAATAARLAPRLGALSGLFRWPGRAAA
jgi:tetratricopeptide (TPR) repeat protein